MGSLWFRNVVVLLSLVAGVHAAVELLTSTHLEKIAFGSCSHQNKDQSVWEVLSSEKPDAWIWLGDVVYADTPVVPALRIPANPSHLEKAFSKQKANVAYQQFVAQTGTILGTWDDHDFGVNDGSSDYAYKAQSQQLFLDFIGEPKDSERCHLPFAFDECIYASYLLGKAGQRVKVILLDVRTFKDPNHLGDVLGEAQWEWFERELNEDNSELILIGSSIQLIPPDKPIQEKWANYRSGRERMLNALLRAPKPVIILSGDVHYGELLQFTCPETGRTLWEITSSGLTHSCGNQLSSLCRVALDTLFLSKYHVRYYEYKNFGMIEFDWSASPPLVSIEVHNAIDGGLEMAQLLELTPVTKPASAQTNLTCVHDVADVNGWVYWELKTWRYLVYGPIITGLVIFLSWKLSSKLFRGASPVAHKSPSTPAKGRAASKTRAEM